MELEVVDVIVMNCEYELIGDDENCLYEIWIFVEGLVDFEMMCVFFFYVCVCGVVYCVEIIGYFDDGSGMFWVEVVIDGIELFVCILFWRDKSYL